MCDRLGHLSGNCIWDVNNKMILHDTVQKLFDKKASATDKMLKTTEQAKKHISPFLSAIMTIISRNRGKSRDFDCKSMIYSRFSEGNRRWSLKMMSFGKKTE